MVMNQRIKQVPLLKYISENAATVAEWNEHLQGLCIEGFIGIKISSLLICYVY